MAPPEIPWVETGHSGITHVAYIEAGNQLWLKYKGGMVYRVTDIPQDHYDKLLCSDAPAQYARVEIAPKFSIRRLHGITL